MTTEARPGTPAQPASEVTVHNNRGSLVAAALALALLSGVAGYYLHDQLGQFGADLGQKKDGFGRLLDGESDKARQRTPMPSSAAGSPSPSASPTPKPSETPSPKPTDSAKAAGLEGGRLIGFDVTTVGIPDKIDASTVDTAKGVFRNTIGKGTEMVLAEPGGLLVGPDFETKATNQNPNGANPAGWAKMYESGGTIKPFSPVSQEVIRWPGEADQNLPEGGFIKVSAGQMRVEIDGGVFDMPAKKGRNYFFIARGIYPDGKQDSDLNHTAKITNYKGGHILVEMHESAEKTNTAFMSEGQFLQTAKTSHSTGTNCGAEGCSELIVVMYDANTKAFATVRQVQGRFQDPSQGWESGQSNWK